MPNKFSKYFSAILILCCSIVLSGCIAKTNLPPVQTYSPTGWINTCVDWDDWDKPSPPFRIYGNSYYVGTCGIAAILITGNDGHILIDGGTEIGATVIANNIKKLGFALTDIKLLLHSHEHFDHVGGLSQLQKLSQAKLLASPEAAPVLGTGVTADDDPQAGMHEPFPAARVDGIVRDGESVKLGNLVLNPIATPGHTRGALSWQWQSCEQKRCLSIVYADSLSPISNKQYHFSDHPDYVDAYKKGLDKLARLDCQILIAPHPSASQMPTRLSSAKGLVESDGCINYANSVSKQLHKRLTKEKRIAQ